MTAAVFAHPALAAQARLATSPLSQVLMAVAVAVAVWETRARTRKTLADLAPEQLFDIGLTRAEALAEAAKPFWRA